MIRKEFDKLLTLLNIAGEVKGRKKFQKIIFILQQKGADFKENFFFHYYGPFSYDLQFEIDDLVESGLINESGNVNFTYTLNESISSTLDINNSIYSYASLIHKLNSQPSPLLELVATMCYLKVNGYNDNEKIEKKVKFLKPNLVNRYKKGAFSLLAELENERIKNFV